MTTVNLRTWALAALPAKLPAVLLLTAGLVAVAVIGYQIYDRPADEQASPQDRRIAGSSDLALSSAGFTVSGDLNRPISPGVAQPVDLRLANPGGTPITVTRITVRLTDLTAPAADDRHPCSGADFTVAQAPADLSLSLAAGESRSLSDLALPPESWPRVGMVDSLHNQDGCKGASLSLEYSATGTSQP